MVSVIELSGARMTLVAALAWRLIAELVRHHPNETWRVWQLHPGISIRGMVALVGSASSEEQPNIQFCLGGPSGHGHISRAFKGLDVPSELREFDFGREMLGSRPAEFVRSLCRTWGLPVVNGKLPPSTPRSLATSLVANLLSRRIMDLTPWRTTAGAFDTSAGGCTIPDWIVDVAQLHERKRDGHGFNSQECQALTRFVLIHAAPDESPCVQKSTLEDAGIVIDLSAGKAIRLTSTGSGGSLDLMDVYGRVGRSMGRLTREVERLMEEG